jgi:FkbM family methyltransferase
LNLLIRIFEIIITPGAFKAFISWKIFSFASFSVISRAKKCGVAPKSIIDVGANIGQFSIAASYLLPDAVIYSVEPDPRVAKKLRNNIEKKHSANIFVTAVGLEDGEVVLRVNEDSQVTSVLPLGKDRIKFFPSSTVKEEIIVPIKKLDSLFSDSEILFPALLKIDVQGLEDKVIKGAERILTKIKWVIIEVSFANLYNGEVDFLNIVDLLEQHGFKFLKPLNFHTSPKTGEIIEMDALFESLNEE